MKNSMRGPLLFILGVTFSGFLFSLHYTRNKDYKDTVAILRLAIQTEQLQETTRIASRVISTSSTKTPHVATPPPAAKVEPVDCNCISKTTGKSYNFCYTDPQNSTSIGKKFDCASLTILEKLNLVENPGPYVDLADSEKNSKNMVFVSAVSENHFNEATHSIGSVYKFYHNAKFILYSLGLNKFYTQTIKKQFSNLEVRVFNTSGYPNYTNHWMEYRFKPLILAEVMKDYENIWWMDAHISVKKPGMIENLFKEISENTKKSVTKVPISIYYFIHSSHSNFATLFTDLLDYFPSNSIPLLKDPNLGGQMGANTMFFSRTEYTIQTFKWWILCALDKNCMNPPGAQVYCSFAIDDRNTKFANCFRFDQSVINLLMLNDFQDYKLYRSKIGSVF